MKKENELNEKETNFERQKLAFLSKIDQEAVFLDTESKKSSKASKYLLKS